MIFWLMLKLEISYRVTVQESPFIIMPLVTNVFFMTLTSCDLNVYNHIRYNLLQDCDYRQKKILQNNFFILE
jgi:hypothetical protein